MYPQIKPVTKHEKESFHKNPKSFIEAKFAILDETHPLVHAVNKSIIQNNLSDTDFYLFLAYYAMAELIEIENQLLSHTSSPTKPIILRDTIL